MVRTKKKNPKSYEQFDEHHAKIGKFILLFAECETYVQMLFWHLARMSRRRALTLFPRMQLSKAIEFIEILARNYPKNIQEEITYILNQLKDINVARKVLVHGTQDISKKQMVYALEHTVKPTQRKRLSFSSRQLDALIHDLRIIQMALIAHLLRRAGKWFKISWQHTVQQTRKTSWQYKLPQRVKNPRNHRARR